MKEWIARYLPAEALATSGAVLGGLLIDYLTKNSVLTAFGATWGENLGFYGTIFFQDLKKRMRQDNTITIGGIIKVLRGIFLEFGTAEFFDSFLIRPMAMYYSAKFIGNLAVGLAVGKLAADLIFYIPTIISYELRKKFIRD